MPFTYSKGDLDAQPWYAGYASASSDIPERYTDFTAPTDAQAQLAASIIEGFSSYQQGMWVQPGLFNGSSITFFSYNDRPGFKPPAQSIWEPKQELARSEKYGSGLRTIHMLKIELR